MKQKVLQKLEHAPILGPDGQQLKMGRVSLIEEFCKVRSHGQGQSENARNRKRVFLATEGDSGTDIWSYWPQGFPVSYDFTVGVSPTNSALFFLRDCELGFMEILGTNNAAAAYQKRDQTNPQLVNVCQLFGEGAFEGSKNALTRNLKIVKVFFDSTWHVVIRGKDGREFFMRREQDQWRAE